MVRGGGLNIQAMILAKFVTVNQRQGRSYIVFNKSALVLVTGLYENLETLFQIRVFLTGKYSEKNGTYMKHYYFVQPAA